MKIRQFLSVNRKKTIAIENSYAPVALNNLRQTNHKKNMYREITLSRFSHTKCSRVVTSNVVNYEHSDKKADKIIKFLEEFWLKLSQICVTYKDQSRNSQKVIFTYVANFSEFLEL